MHHGNGFAGKRKVAQIWHTKYGVYRRKEKTDVRDDPMLGRHTVRLLRKGLLGCPLLDNTGIAPSAWRC